MARITKEKVLEATQLLLEVVGGTLGPGGHLVKTREGITKDGVSIARELHSEDKVVETVLSIIKESCEKMLTDIADGTTTATVLTCLLIEEFIKNDFNKLELVRYLSKLKEDFKNYCEKYSTNDITPEKVAQILKVASNNDEEIIKNVLDIYNLLGKDFNATCHKTEFSETKVLISEGYKIERGLLKPDFIKKNGVLKLQNAAVLLFTERLEDFKTIQPLISKSLETSKSVILIAKDFSEDFLNICVINFNNGVLIIPIKAPDFQKNMLEKFEDIKIVCDSTIINPILIKNKDFKQDVKIGKLKSFTTSWHITVLESLEEQKPKLLERITYLEHLIQNSNNSMEIAKLNERVKNLKGRFADIYVGGTTFSEIHEKFDRYEDAIGSLSSAFKSGLVVGGGQNFFDFGKTLSNDNNAFTKYLNVLWNNIGLKEEIKQKYLLEVGKNNILNLNTLNVENAFEAGILDSTMMQILAVETAIKTTILILNLKYVL